MYRIGKLVQIIVLITQVVLSGHGKSLDFSETMSQILGSLILNSLRKPQLALIVVWTMTLIFFILLILFLGNLLKWNNVFDAGFLHFICIFLSLFLCTLLHHRNGLLDSCSWLIWFLTWRFIIRELSFYRLRDGLLRFLNNWLLWRFFNWLYWLLKKSEFFDRLELLPQYFREFKEFYLLSQAIS